MAIPDTVAPVAIHTILPGLVHHPKDVSNNWPAHRILPMTSDGFPDILPPGTIVAIQRDSCVILGPILGEGRQSRVYEIATCDQACIKLGRNRRSAKQFRRELLGYPIYLERQVRCPRILGADSQGHYILKERMPATLIDGPSILKATARVLPISYVRALRRYALSFEAEGITVDGLPSNVIFHGDECASYETTTWDAPPRGEWTFASCFLLEWLPTVMSHRSPNGWPPFRLTTIELLALQHAWYRDKNYAAWREVFGHFPQLCSDWWIVE
jgi:hypothetical protein